MSDHDLTNTPIPGGSRHVTTGLPPRPPVTDWPNISIRRPNFQSDIRFCLRAAGTVAVAAVFVYLCWLMCDSADPNVNILAGPVLLLRWGDADKLSGFAMVVVLLPCIFAVGVRINPVTFALSVFGCLAWLVLGLFVVGMSV
jgi:hypothetical protein